MEGTIKWFKREKGFGFIVGEDSKEYFVHYTSMPDGQEDIRDTDKVAVTFDVKETDRGSQAQNIQIKK
jgi:CspA family cold shock protein